MKKGFTLIELLVVVLIIGILSAVAMPQYTKAVKKSRMAGVVSKLRTVLQAGEAYMLANDLSSMISGNGFVVTMGIDNFDISLPSDREDLKTFSCVYQFRWVASTTSDIKYMATCDGTVTARGDNWIQNGTQLAQNKISEAEYLVASTVDAALSVVDSFQYVYAMSNLNLYSSYNPFSYSYSTADWLAAGSKDSDGGSGNAMAVGLTNTGQLFCSGTHCKEYGFSKVSSLSASDVVAYSGTLYAM